MPNSTLINTFALPFIISFSTDLDLTISSEPKYAPVSVIESFDNQPKKSLNQTLATKSITPKPVEEVEDYMELTELTDFEELSFDPTQMTAIIDKEENITFTQDSLSLPGNFSIITTANLINEDITLSEGNNECTYKIEYQSDSSNSGHAKQFACRHCGKEYRWKSTLRRHENVECGGKAPSYECPYCDYKAKQRGNLGVHVRKHHPNLPELASKRKRNSKV